MSHATVEALKKASKGLLYQSETDAPFEVFTWRGGKNGLSKKKVLELGKHDAGAPVEEESLDDFFGELTKEEDWHGPEEKADAKKYQSLLKAVKEHLSGAKVFKVGEREKAVYIVGKTPEGDWAGLKTKAVET